MGDRLPPLLYEMASPRQPVGPPVVGEGLVVTGDNARGPGRAKSIQAHVRRGEGGCRLCGAPCASSVQTSTMPVGVGGCQWLSSLSAPSRPARPCKRSRLGILLSVLAFMRVFFRRSACSTVWARSPTSATTQWTSAGQRGTAQARPSQANSRIISRWLTSRYISIWMAARALSAWRGAIAFEARSSCFSNMMARAIGALTSHFSPNSPKLSASLIRSFSRCRWFGVFWRILAWFWMPSDGQGSFPFNHRRHGRRLSSSRAELATS